MKYEMLSPCSLCPFRNDDGRLHVYPDRLREFGRGQFVCHQTAEYYDADDRDPDGDSESGYVEKFNGSSQHCAGALIFHAKNGSAHFMMIAMEQAGFYDPSKLKMDSPVFGSFAEVDEAEKTHPFRRKRKAK